MEFGRSKIRRLTEKQKKIVAASQKWHCGECGELLSSAYQVDHIIPHCVNGDDSPDNLLALCANCHALKTQRESSKIVKFKQLRGLYGLMICWICMDKNIECQCDTNLMEEANIAEETYPTTVPNILSKPKETYPIIYPTTVPNILSKPKENPKKKFPTNELPGKLKRKYEPPSTSFDRFCYKSRFVQSDFNSVVNKMNTGFNLVSKDLHN